MSLEPLKTEINGRNYLIGMWTVDKSLETMVWLTKTFGEGFLSLFMSDDGIEGATKLIESAGTEDAKKNAEELKKEKALILEFAGKIRDQLNAKEYVHYSKVVISGIRCNGQPINFNTHFTGKMLELHMLMFKCLRHQYSDFLGANAEND